MLRTQCSINSKIHSCEKDKLEVLYDQICADYALKTGVIVAIRVTGVEDQGVRE